MTPPDQTPKLPKWIFFLTDAVLLFLAWYIAANSARPLSGTALLSILSCVIAGALIATVPLIAHYERVKNETLDERQRALESLALTIAASAEQIGIAAHGLHEIAELAQRNLKAAEQLPARLQEKIAGLKTPPDHSRDPEKEELKKELARLRSSESERLQSAAEKITKAVADLSKLARREHVERARAEPASTEPSRSVEQASPEPVEWAITEAPLAPPAEILPLTAIVSDDSPPPPPKRTRKPKPEASAPTPEASDSGNQKSEIENLKSEEPPPIPAAAIPEVVPVAPDSNPPIPDAPGSEAPKSEIENLKSEDPAPAPDVAPLEAPPSKPERKRAPRKPKAEAPVPEPSGSENLKSEIGNLKSEEPALDLVETPAASAAEVVERAVSSDGATRLLVTAYIGIGNRLFIRGSGPGLSWDKGLPLQFVSIGKWRWETSEASAPVQFKLYKNDDSECAALGTQTLDPGQQQEVTATF